MNLILTSFVICGAVLSVITLHSCWIHRKTVLTWIYPVVAMLAIMFAAHGVEEIQGFPLNAKPNVEFEYLTHYEEGESVLVLLKISGETKTYRFVPSKEEKSVKYCSRSSLCLQHTSCVRLWNTASPSSFLILK